MQQKTLSFYSSPHGEGGQAKELLSGCKMNLSAAILLSITPSLFETHNLTADVNIDTCHPEIRSSFFLLHMEKVAKPGTDYCYTNDNAKRKTDSLRRLHSLNQFPPLSG